MKYRAKHPGLIRAQNGAPGPASGVTYDVDIMLPDGVLRRNGVIPSTIRPIAALDVAALEKMDILIDVWEFDGGFHYDFDEPIDSEDCDAPGPAPLMSQIIAALSAASASDKALLRQLLGVAPA